MWLPAGCVSCLGQGHSLGGVTSSSAAADASRESEE